MIRLIPFEEFGRRIVGKKVVLFGAGKQTKEIIQLYDYNYVCAIDNNSFLNGKSLQIGGKRIPIYGWDYIYNISKDEVVLLVTPKTVSSMIDQIEREPCLSEVDTYIFMYMKALQWDLDRGRDSLYKFDITKTERHIIPKIIHYFWFSEDPYPEKVEKCINSWRKYCPDYEFMKWDLNNYITDNAFCNEALSVKNWAFASDYGRCDVVYRYGGIYLDTDVELLKPLDDLLFDEGFFVFESAMGVDPGSGMAGIKGHRILREILDKYDNVHFVRDDGSYNKVFILDQYTDVLCGHGLIKDGKYQKVDGFAVYPPLVMSPYSYQTGLTNIIDKTYGIHHWVSAWLTQDERREMDYRKSYFEKHYK